jgi:hypothetical protein
MVALILGMLICVGLAVAVVAVVAIPARREGRELLTPQGEELIAVVKEKTESTLEKTGDAITSAKDMVSDKVTDTVTSSAPRETVEDTGRHRAGCLLHHPAAPGGTVLRPSERRTPVERRQCPVCAGQQPADRNTHDICHGY